jgi:hypothetical protein
MIRIERTPLPAGLSAIARRAGRADIVIIVSDVLSPAEQRAAVRAALRAARRRDWRGGLLPLPVIAGLAAFRSLAVRTFRVLRIHSAVSWAVASGVTVAAAGAVGVSVLVPHAHVGSAVGPGAPGYVARPGGGSGGHGAPGPARTSAPEPRVVGITSPAPGAHPSPRPSGSATSSSAPPGSSQPARTPGPSTSPPSGGSSASPSPTTSPGSSSGSSPCVTLLAVKVCL